MQDARESGRAHSGDAPKRPWPWWDAADAPSAAAVLQATVQQGRHEFAAARRVLINSVAREPGNAQAWLNLAALERLSANARKHCTPVPQWRTGQALYAQGAHWRLSPYRAVTRTQPPACNTCLRRPTTAGNALGCCPWPRRTKNARGTMAPPTVPMSTSVTWRRTCMPPGTQRSAIAHRPDSSCPATLRQLPRPTRCCCAARGLCSA